MATVVKKRRQTEPQLRKAFERATKLSTILAIGLHDLRLAESSKKLSVYMGSWLCDSFDGHTCFVCLAGSVMAGRYKSVVARMRRKAVVALSVSPDDFEGRDMATEKFYALNLLRTGRVSLAAYYLGISGVKPTLDRCAAEYDLDKEAWWADMRVLLKDLRAAGL